MNKITLAACGIDCNECGQYKVTAHHDIKAAQSLVAWFQSRGWIGENESAEAVMKKAPLCNGCRDKTGACFCGSCNLRTCCEERQLSHCCECGDFPCDTYINWIGGLAHHKKAMEYLMPLKENT